MMMDKIRARKMAEAAAASIASGSNGPAQSPITVDFCIWLHRNAERIIADLQGQPVAIPAAPMPQAASVGRRTCNLCDLPIHGRGLCRVHYGRMKRTQQVGA